ncbi:MAG: IS1595 family transposase [bacterium]|nr:IS1595 family transposase [bacterium]
MKTGYKAPGKSYRQGISVLQVADMFSTEEKAVSWFEFWNWPTGDLSCMRCGSEDAYRVKSGKPMPYRCRKCRKYFSLKTGTVMEDSKLPLRVWGWAIYLELTNLKGVSSMKLHRDLGISQSAAWFVLHRIREAFSQVGPQVFSGPVEVDETYVGGLERNKHAHKKANLGRGPVGKTAVVGMKDRATNRVVARVVPNTSADTLQGFVEEHRVPNAPVYTDGSTAYDGLPNRQAVHHSVGEYVSGKAHVNGVESFWSMLKRAHKGVYHRLSPKHLQRYVDEFCGRQNIRELDTLAQMQHVVAGMMGKRLMYCDLTAGTRGRAT